MVTNIEHSSVGEENINADEVLPHQATTVRGLTENLHIESCAAAADKTPQQFVQDGVKTLITKTMLNAPLSLNFRTADGELIPVALKHPDTVGAGNEGVDLTMGTGGFVVERSGPYFSGHLNPGIGQEHLPEVAGRKQDIQEHIDAVQAKYTNTPHAAIDESAKTLDQKNDTQRLFSDADLQAVDLTILGDSIAHAYEQQTGEVLNESLRMDAALGAWQFGGAVDIDRLQRCERGESVSYLIELRNELSKVPHEERPHFVQDSIKPAIHEAVQGSALEGKVDTPFRNDMGPRMFVMAPDLIVQNGKFVSADAVVGLSDKAREKQEVADIIMDSTYPLGSLVNERLVAKRQITAMKERFGEDLVDAQMAKQSPDSFEMEKLFSDIEKSTEQTLTGERAQYTEDLQQSRMMQRMQEGGKKEALSQYQLAQGQTKKLIGNMSDIAADVASMSGAQKELFALSTLMNLPRWHVGEEGLDALGSIVRSPQNPEKPNFTAQEFADSINGRTYGEEGGVREKMGWNNISEEEAAVRMGRYEKGIGDVTSFCREQKDYFRATDQYKQMLDTWQKIAQTPSASPQQLAEVSHALHTAQQQVHQEFGKVFASPEMAELRGELGLDSDTKIQEVSTQLADRVVLSVQAAQAQLSDERMKEQQQHKADEIAVRTGLNSDDLMKVMDAVKRMNEQTAGGGVGETSLPTMPKNQKPKGGNRGI